MQLPWRIFLLNTSLQSAKTQAPQQGTSGPKLNQDLSCEGNGAFKFDLLLTHVLTSPTHKEPEDPFIAFLLESLENKDFSFLGKTWIWVDCWISYCCWNNAGLKYRRTDHECVWWETEGSGSQRWGFKVSASQKIMKM